MNRLKKITPITEEDFQKVINNSVMGEGSRLVGSAAEQKKLFVKPIAAIDDGENVMQYVQRLANETIGAVENIEKEMAELSEKVVTPPTPDSIPLHGVFLVYNAEEESLEITGETGVTEENVEGIVDSKIGALVGDINGSLEDILGV